MDQHEYAVARLDLEGHADLVLLDTNVCLDKTLTDDQALAAFRKALTWRLSRDSPEKSLTIRCLRWDDEHLKILVEVGEDGD